MSNFDDDDQNRSKASDIRARECERERNTNALMSQEEPFVSTQGLSHMLITFTSLNCCSSVCALLWKIFWHSLTCLTMHAGTLHPSSLAHTRSFPHSVTAEFSTQRVQAYAIQLDTTLRTITLTITHKCEKYHFLM